MKNVQIALPMKVQDFLDLLCKTLLLPAKSISQDDTQDTVPNWDSLGHLEIIDVVDSLGVDTNDERLQKFTTIAELVQQLRDRGVLQD
jgi:acyl carrier protein